MQRWLCCPGLLGTVENPGAQLSALTPVRPARASGPLSPPNPAPWAFHRPGRQVARREAGPHRQLLPPAHLHPCSLWPLTLCCFWAPPADHRPGGRGPRCPGWSPDGEPRSLSSCGLQSPCNPLTSHHREEAIAPSRCDRSPACTLRASDWEKGMHSVKAFL